MVKRGPAGLKKAESKDPLSAKAYVIVSLAGFILALGFTFFYVYEVPRLAENGAQNQVFYLLLLPWALACAAFLFGAMRSYALFTYRHLGSFLELGGPAVFFCLVLVGGFRLVPSAPETFDLAVRAFSTDHALIRSGEITLDIPGLPHARIGPDGEANFKGISAKFKGRPVRVLTEIKGYTEKWLTPTVDGPVLTVELPGFTQIATLRPPPPKGKNIQILVDGQKIDTSFDDIGQFKFPVNGEARRALIEVYVDQELAGVEHYDLGAGPINIHWASPH